MVVVIDILQALDAHGSLDRELLANTLGCDPVELDGPLVLGVRRGLIGVGAQGWAEDPGSFVGSYTITDVGRRWSWSYPVSVDTFGLGRNRLL